MRILSHRFENFAKQIQSTTVYWFDDQPWGGCKIPDSWTIQHKDANGNWQNVENVDSYPIKKGTACTANFKPVKTSEVKILVKQPAKFSCGLFEWSVK